MHQCDNSRNMEFPGKLITAVKHKSDAIQYNCTTSSSSPPLTTATATAEPKCKRRRIELLSLDMTNAMDPLFLTCKLRVHELSNVYNVYDFQLRDHFFNMRNLYITECECKVHKHNKKKCRISYDLVCDICRKPNLLLIDYQGLLFHSDMLDNNLRKCCKHTHKPPCGRCINCNTNQTCSILNEFECDKTTDAICERHETPRFTKNLGFSDIAPEEHVFNIKNPQFYFCFTHRHYHNAHMNIICIIQTFKCCSSAISVEKFKSSFIVTCFDQKDDAKITTTTTTTTSDTSNVEIGQHHHMNEYLIKGSIGDTTGINSSGLCTNKLNGTRKQPQLKKKHYIIFDPSIWRDQSYNYFMSFIRAIITMPAAIAERYKRFESSNFTISNIKRYKSGKESLARTVVTGFDAKGIYQTAIISCTLPYNKVLIPQKIYKILKNQHYDLTFACVKRDPAISPTCMYVCLIEENPDPTIDVIVISEAISKGLNQDQDGDKNAAYELQTKINGYDCTESYKFKVARMEMANAFGQKRTILCRPRYHYSETNLILMKRNADAFCNDIFYKRIRGRGVRFANEAGAGYLETEKTNHDNILLELNKSNKHKILTSDSILLKTPELTDIIESGAKGDLSQLQILLTNISKKQTLINKIPSMISLCNKYISFGQELRYNGRSQFTALYATHDLITLNGKIYLNKVCLADYGTFASILCWIFNEASLQLFLEDLQNNYESLI